MRWLVVAVGIGCGAASCCVLGRLPNKPAFDGPYLFAAACLGLATLGAISATSEWCRRRRAVRAWRRNLPRVLGQDAMLHAPRGGKRGA